MSETASSNSQGLGHIHRVLVAAGRRIGLGRLRSVVWAYEHAIAPWIPSIVSHRGCRFVLDPRDGRGPAFADEHEAELNFLLANLRPQDVVLDIGANGGLFTVILAKALGSTGHVYAFEPEPRNLGRLRRNVQLNELANVTILPHAVSDRTGKGWLHLSKTHNGLHRMHPSRLCRHQLEVQCIRLDEFAPVADRGVDVVKIDVEGHELQVLRGMAEVIDRTPGIKLFMEFCPRWLEEAGSHPETVLRMLADRGFEFWDAATRAPAAISTEQLLLNYTVQNARSTNLWCVRSAATRTGVSECVNEVAFQNVP